MFTNYLHAKKEIHSYINIKEKEKHKKTFNLSNIVVKFVTNVTGVKVLKGVSNQRKNIACIVQWSVQNGLNHNVLISYIYVRYVFVF